MSVTTFEVRVEVNKGNGFWGTHPQLPNQKGRKSAWIIPKILKMFHIDARTHKQAINKAKKHGDVVSCRRVDAYAMLGNPENLKLDQLEISGAGSLFKDAIAMDEMIWQKRNKRRANSHKDKKGY